MGVVKDQPIENSRVQPPECFEISGVYLLNKDGSILAHRDVGDSSDFDADLFGAMFSGIKIFLGDSLQSDSQLECINYSGFKILIERKMEFFLVMVGTGAVDNTVKDNMKWLAERIALDYGRDTSRLKGDDPDLITIHGILDNFTRLFLSKE